MLKKESSWEKLKGIGYNKNLISLLGDDYIVTEEERDGREKEEVKKKDNDDEVGDDIFIISEIRKLGIKFWDGLNIFMIRNEIENVNHDVVKTILKKLKGNKGIKGQREVNTGRRLLNYLSKTPHLIEEIKSLSSLSDKKEVNLKFIYDQLKAFGDENWKRAIAIGEQLNKFEYQELSNIKSVYDSIKSNKRIGNENSLIKAYESLKKLDSLGIKI